MDYEILTREPLRVCGLRTALSASQSENYRIMRRHWPRFNRELGVRGLTGGGNWEKYGITLRTDGGYDCLTAIPADGDIPGFETMELAGGRWARFRHAGGMDEMKRTVHVIYRQVIPASGLAVAGDRTVMHLEYYDHRFCWNHPASVIDILVPLES